MSLSEVHLVGGDHAAAVRLAAVAAALRGAGLLAPVPLAAGRRPELVAETFAALGATAEVTLPAPSDDATELTDTVRELDELWSVRTPAAVLVQGDSPTSLAAAIAAFWRRIPVAHLGAGRRCVDLSAATPAEADRRLLAQLTALHLTPSGPAAMNLLDERIEARDLLVTGDPAPGQGDGGAARRAAQAVAGMLGLAPTPEPLPVTADGVLTTEALA